MNVSLAVLLGCFVFAGSDLLIKTQATSATVALLLLISRAAGSGVLLLAGKVKMPPPTVRKEFGFMVGCWGVSGTLFGWCLSVLPLSTVIASNALSSALSVFFSAIYLKERILRSHLLALLLTCAGVVMMAQPEASGLLGLLALGLSATTFALGNTVSRKMVKANVSAETVATGNFLVVAAFSAVGVGIAPVEMPFSWELLWFGLAAGLLLAVGLPLMTWAHRYGSASLVSILGLSYVGYGVTFDVLVFNRILAPVELAGLGLLVVGALMCAFAERVRPSTPR